ncbi:hypothetical protein GCM10020218_100020 [Dactylosporangium vinaceum]|uniref:Transposase n=1 Tax=Dactylosporangium vinaceum TaxID=53362 RepID=A0ABV5M730_9ACTN|nr:hypothetical protein [Dactylosporangium vinaceum]
MLSQQRHAVGCAVNQLKLSRGMAARFHKPIMRYQATATVAAINAWL